VLFEWRPRRRRETPSWSEGRHIRVTCGPQDINAGMAGDMCGFRDNGFGRLAAVRSGCQPLGLDGEMDGCFAEAIGDDLWFQPDGGGTCG
jgi:hypothetical protein